MNTSTQQTIAVLGSGAMGSGIAQVAAQAGHTVIVYDLQPAALQRAAEGLRATLNKLVEKGRMTTPEADALLERIQYTHRLEDCAPATLAIEAVVEDLGVKRQLFARLEELLPAEAVLASNTSSLSITSIAAACRRPERVVGLHFFNPAPLMALVEVVPAIQTAPGLADDCCALMRAWGKTPVCTKDTPGFIVNRVARPYYGEALRLLDEGRADMATIDWAMTELGGFRMGPFALMDYIGHDVNYKVTETVFTAFYYDPRYKPSLTQLRLVEAGFLGRKSGRGFYDYQTGAVLPEPLRDPALGRYLVDRIVAMLINEAADALLWGIASAEDLDLAMTRGVNYPKGLLAWAREWGPARVAALLDGLYEEYREDRYRCSPMLRRMANEG